MKSYQKMLSWVLAIVMTLSCLPLPVLASNGAQIGYREPASPTTPERDKALKNGKIFSLRINGEDVVGQTLTGNYEFFCLTREGDHFLQGAEEQGSTYRWLRAETRNGDYSPIAGATKKTYVLTQADQGKYIRFEVTPKTAATTGETVQSEPVGPVLSAEAAKKINPTYKNTKNVYENDAAIAAAVQQKLGNAVYFTCDSKAGNATLHGSDIAMVRGIKTNVNGQIPVLNEDNHVTVTPKFVRTVLGMDCEGTEPVDLEQVTKGKYVWIGTDDVACGGNFRTTPLTRGLVIVSDTKLDLDEIRDRDLLNEAANSLYQLRSTEEQMQWFRDAKYGMFIHWDPSSISQAEISWDRMGQRPGETWVQPEKKIYADTQAEPQYDSLYMDFNPTKWDADALMKKAKENGIRYVVFTAKHHGAFSNFQTQYRRNFSIANTPYQGGEGDICRQLAEAARKYGMKLGFYYSPRDWTNPYYYTEEHYRYLDYYLGQLTELCSNYGGLDMLWFDSIGSANGFGGYQDAFSAWELRTILRRIRQMQPDIVINNRYAASLANYNQTPYDVMGDWDTPETRLGDFQDSRPWESCMCPDASGSHWSDHYDVTSYISADKALKYLINNACKDGNLLMDFGPTKDGTMRREVQNLFDGVGTWLQIYGDSIYGTRGGPYKNVAWGGSTYRDKQDGSRVLYLHVSPLMTDREQPAGTLTIPQAPDGRTYDVANATRLDGKPVTVTLSDGQYQIQTDWDSKDTVIVLKEEHGSALQAVLAETDALLEGEQPAVLAGPAAKLRALRAQAEKNPAQLPKLREANRSYRLQKQMAENLTVLEEKINAAQIGTNLWEVSEETYNRAVSVYKEAKNLLTSGRLTQENVELANENMRSAIDALNSAGTCTITAAPAGGHVQENTAITLETSAAYAAIHYTTDGTEPDAASPVYRGPLQPGAGLLHLKAAGFFGDKRISDVMEATYQIGAFEPVKTGDAAASDVYENMQQYDASKAFDGRVDTRWATSAGGNQSLQVELASEQTFDALRLVEYLDVHNIEEGRTTRIDSMNVLVSQDGTKWTTIADQVSCKSNMNSVTKINESEYRTDLILPLPQTKAKYVKLELNNCTGAPTIFEVQLFQTEKSNVTADYLTLEVESTIYTPGQALHIAAYGERAGETIPADQITYLVTPDTVSVKDGKIIIPDNMDGEITIQAQAGDLKSSVVTLKKNTETNIARGSTAKGSTQWDASHGAANVVDGSMDTRWASKGFGTDGSSYKTELILTNLQGNYYNKVVLEEYLEPDLPPRVDYIELQKKNDEGEWETFALWGENMTEDRYPQTTYTMEQTDSAGKTFFYDRDAFRNQENPEEILKRTHTFTFPEIIGTEIRMLFTNSHVCFFEAQVFGGTKTLDTVLPQSIVLHADSCMLDVDATAQITAQVHPVFATNKDLNYESSNKQVATVDSKGLVQAKTPGSAQITVSAAAAPAVKAVFYVTVTSDQAQAHPITVADVQHGKLTVKEKEMAGRLVLVTAQPDAGYVLDQAKVNDRSIPGVKGMQTFTFTMPDEAVTLHAVFKEKAAHTHKLIPVPEKAATCTEAGQKACWVCEECGTYFADEQAKKEIPAPEQVEALGHAWGEAAYQWSENGKTCLATRTCTRNQSHRETAAADVTGEQTLAPTEQAMGQTTYTAKFYVDWAKTQTKTVTDIPTQKPVPTNVVGSIDARRAKGTAKRTVNSNAADLTSVAVEAKAGESLTFEKLDFADARVLMLVAAVGHGSGGKQIDIYADSVSEANHLGTMTLHGEKKDNLDFGESYADLTKDITGIHDLILQFKEDTVLDLDWVLLTHFNNRETEEEKNAHMQWWRDARFGQFMHFGAYAQLGGVYNGQKPSGGTGYSEWIMNDMGIPEGEYAQNVPTKFNPTEFNAKKIVSDALAAGQKYLVFTTRHHEGFSMFDTQVRNFRDYSLFNVNGKTYYTKDTDPLMALSQECEKQGLVFGTYSSILDWHDPSQRGQNGRGYGKSIKNKEDFKAQLKAQVKELIEVYHTKILWFDGDWSSWWTKEDGDELYRFIRSLDESIIVNNRVGKRQLSKLDFDTPEQEIPATGLDFDWESCVTINNSWGYKKDDNHWKSPQWIVNNVLDIASKGGNLLLNVGPDETGVVQQEAIDNLKAAGQWFLKFGDEALYGTRANCFAGPLPEHVRITTRQDKDTCKIYVNLINGSDPAAVKTLALPPLTNRIVSVKELSNGKNVPYAVTGQALTLDIDGTEKQEYATTYVLTVEGVPEEKPVVQSENLAYRKPVEGSTAYDDTHTAQKMTDGNRTEDGSRWAPADDDKSPAAVIDLGEQKEIDVIKLYEWKDAQKNAYRCSRFRISVSDDKQTWTTVYTGTEIGAQHTAMLNEPTKARYVKVDQFAKKEGALGWPSLYEVEVYGPETYTIRVESTVHGQITVPQAQAAGALIKPVVEPETGYQLKQLTVKQEDGTEVPVNQDYSFVMPEANVVISALFEEIGQAHTHTLVKVEGTDATCTQPGTKTYWTCESCGKHFADEKGQTEIEDLDAWKVIPARNHDWDKPVYEFAEDGSTCTAIRTCKNDQSHQQTAHAKITSKVTKYPTATMMGETTYTAEFDVDWAETQTQTVTDIPATDRPAPHVPVEKPVKPQKAELPFVDVPKTQWYYDSVYSAWEQKLIDGMTATTFMPDHTLTVAQAIKLAAVTHQREKLGSVTLTNGIQQWYSTYVDYAIANGIVAKDYAAYTEARMNAPVTRREFVKILHGAKTFYAEKNKVADDAIPDVKMHDQSAEEIYAFYRAGILTGSDAEGRFYPESHIKRSEVAAILVRMYDIDARQSIELP